MNTIYFKVVESLERKLQRQLTKGECDFVKWIAKQHLKEKIPKK